MSADAGYVGKVEGMAAAAAGAGESWMERALGAVREVAETQDTFTTDDVWATGRVPKLDGLQGDSRAMGPVMCRAASLGLCKKISKRTSGRTERHQGYVTVWASLLRGGVPMTDTELVEHYREVLAWVSAEAPLLRSEIATRTAGANRFRAREAMS